MDKNTDIQHSDGTTDETELKRPTGKYDNVVLIIERFPLRIVILIAWLGVCLNYYSHIHELTYVIPGAPFGATFLYFLMAIAWFAELVTGWLTRHIKDFIIKRVMQAEENADVL